MKMLVAVLLAVTTLFSLVACNTNNGKTWLDRYLCIQHEYGEGVVRRESTCLREGAMVFTCKKCGEEKTEKTLRKSHTPYTVAAKESTCGTSGYTQHTACAVCGTAIEGKETLPKLQCTGEHKEYFGLGVYSCQICGQEWFDYNEHPLINAKYFEFGKFYRFYVPQDGSEAFVTFKYQSLDGGYWGYIETPNGASNPVSSFSIGAKRINGEVVGVIWYGTGEGSLPFYLYDVDEIFREGPDYMDFYISTDFIQAEDKNGNRIEVQLRRDAAISISAQNGAMIVELD